MVISVQNKVVKVISIYLALFLLLGVSGCMTNQSYKEKMLAYMNAKYDDIFEYYAPFGGGAGATSTQIIVKSEKLPEAQIWVEYFTSDGKEVFADNYVEYKYEAQAYNMLKSLLEGVFECEVFLSFGVGSRGSVNDFTGRTTFEEYIASPEAHLGFNAVVSTGRTALEDADVEKLLAAAFIGAGMVADGDIYFAVDDDTCEALEKLTRDQRHSMRRLIYTMSSLTGFDSCQWR